MATPQRYSFTPEDGSAVIDLDDGDVTSSSPYRVVGADGLGLPEIINQTSPRAGRSGSDSIYVAYTGREFTVSLRIVGDSAAQAQGYLKTLAQRLSLTLGLNQPRFGVLEIEGFDNTTRAIRCGVMGGLELARGQSLSPGGFVWELPLQFYAPTPFFYDPVEQQVALPAPAYPYGAPRLGGALPLTADTTGSPFPWTMGFDRALSEVSVMYAGDAVTETLRLDLPGPLDSPALYLPDDDLNARIRFNGIVPASRSLTVRMGNRPDWAGGFDARLDNGESWTGFVVSGSRALNFKAGSNRLWFETRNFDAPSGTLRWFSEYLSGGT